MEGDFRSRHNSRSSSQDKFDRFFADTLTVLDVEQALNHFRASVNRYPNRFRTHRSTNWSSCFFPQVVNTDKGQIKDPRQICKVFNEHFVDTGRLFNRTYNESHVPTADFDATVTPGFYFKLFTCEEVCKALQEIDLKKGVTDADGLEPSFLRHEADKLDKYITHIFNLSVSTGTIPEVWKKSYVTPLHKDGETSDLNNYRPISKLPCLAKILERLVKNQLTSFLTENQMLHERQSAYRENHSNVTAATAVLNDIITDLDDDQHCAVLFTDLSKAFDTVDHAVLLKKLERIGFDGKAFKWFENYFQDRHQSVTNGNVASDFLRVETGVPQGSVLGPVLFNIYMADIASSVKGCKFHMFADDTVLYCSAGDAESAITTLQQCFTHLQNEFRKHKLVLNAKKTKYMMFPSDSDVDDGLVLSSLDGTNIERVKKYKYLGLWIDEDLSFADHVTTLASDLTERIHYFQRKKSHLTTERKKDLVRKEFLSKFHKGHILYMHASPEALTQLDDVYHSALKFIQGHGDDDDHHVLYHEMRLLCPSLMRESHLLLFIYKALKGFLPPYIKSMLVKDEARSGDCILLKEPKASTEVGKTRFSFFGPRTWNKMQEELPFELSESEMDAKSLILSYLTSECYCPCWDCKWGL